MPARVHCPLLTLAVALTATLGVLALPDRARAQSQAEITLKNESSETVRIYIWDHKAKDWVTFGGKDKGFWYEVGKGREVTRALPAAGEYIIWLQNKSGVMHMGQTFKVVAGAPFKDTITEVAVEMTEMRPIRRLVKGETGTKEVTELVPVVFKSERLILQSVLDASRPPLKE